MKSKFIAFIAALRKLPLFKNFAKPMQSAAPSESVVQIYEEFQEINLEPVPTPADFVPIQSPEIVATKVAIPVCQVATEESVTSVSPTDVIVSEPALIPKENVVVEVVTTAVTEPSPIEELLPATKTHRKPAKKRTVKKNVVKKMAKKVTPKAASKKISR